MIYIKNSIETKIPRSCGVVGTLIKLEHQTNHTEYEFNVSVVSDYYYSLNSDDYGMEDGQYNYAVYNGDNIVESGIAQVGEFDECTNVQYNIGKTAYKTYKYD